MIKKIVLAILGVAVVGGAVFGGMLFLVQRPDYAGASNYVNEILKTRDEVTGVLTNETADSANFEARVAQIKEYYTSLGASSALKDEKIKVKYDELAGMVGKFDEIVEFKNWLEDLQARISAEGYEAVEAQVETPNDFAAKMLEEMKAYGVRVAEFEQKYGGGKTVDEKQVTEEYGEILKAGEALEKKYEEVGLMDAVGVAAEEVEAWFSGLEELKGQLEAKR